MEARLLSSQEEQNERRRVTLQDARLREQQQGSTYLAQTHSEMGGRFASVGAATVVGSKADVAAMYPAAAAAHQVQLPDEPPLSFDNPALDPQSMTTEGSGSGADAPLAHSPDVEQTAPLSQTTGGMTAEGKQSRSPSDGYVVSPGFRRRV